MLQAIIENGRADYALNAVKIIVNDKDDKTKKEYKSYVKKLPALVLSNGLAAAVAFMAEKGGSYMLIHDNVNDWLIKNAFYTDIKLCEYVSSLDSVNYRVVTNEVLALTKWLKMFAGGLIEGEAEDI